MPLKSLLMVPGPTPVPDAVLRASAAPMVNHRGPEFARVLKECVEFLNAVFATKSDVLPFPASGTGGLEAAIVNVLSPGDRVLSCSIGAFGDRFGKIAARFGAKVETCGFQWGEAASPATIAEHLNADREGAIKAVLLTHNETSTGVVNDVQAISKIVRQHGALLLVDAISGLIAHPLPVDEWELDVVVAGSQKAFMIPPGLCFVSVGPRAWQAHQKATMPRYYFDFTEMKNRELTPYTPPVSLFYALQEAGRMLLAEGLAAVVQRHRTLAAATQAGVTALGLSLLAPEGSRSSAVTAIRTPEGISPKSLRSHLQNQYGVVAAGGQGKLDGEIFRIGHLGYIAWSDIVSTIAALEMTLIDLGQPVRLGAGVAAVQQVIQDSMKG